MDHPTARYQGYIPAFDGLRAVAILLVLFRHTTVMGPSGWLETPLINLADLGWMGVDLFFVLSGFLITGILLETKTDPHYFRTFYTRRFLRIFPLYYAYIAFVMLLVPSIAAGLDLEWPYHVNEDGWWFWLYLSNVYYSIGGQAHSGALMVTWSLAVEEQFYLLWPAVVLLCTERTLRRICVGLIIGAFVLRSMLVYGGASVFSAYSLLPCRMDTLAMGALLALFARGPISTLHSRRVAKATVSVGVLVILAIWITQDTPNYSNPWYLTVGFSAIAFSFGALLWLVLTASPERRTVRFLCTRPMLFIGKVSYGIYLNHTLIIGPMQRFVLDPTASTVMWGSHLAAQVSFMVLCLASSFAIAWLSWNVFEKHILKLKRLFPYEHATMSTEGRR
jgi:peptidoglycan/LPS O-acetylase OafA/YrhL